MEENTQQPSEQSPERTEEGPPVPNPERENGGDADDIPSAD
ncbi:MAG: hypothetical protein ACRDOS_12190 [Gaiellaceae bacterium]